MDVGEPMQVPSLGDNSNVMIIVDYYSRVKFMKKSDATAAFMRFIDKFITPEGIKVGTVRMDNGGEPGASFDPKLYELDITLGHTPSDTPQFHHVAATGSWVRSMRKRSG